MRLVPGQVWHFFQVAIDYLDPLTFLLATACRVLRLKSEAVFFNWGPHSAVNHSFSGGPSLSSSQTAYKAAHVISQGKIFWNTSPWPGIEPGPQGEDRQWDTFIPPTGAIGTGPWRGETDRYIYSPTDLSWPGLWRGQTLRFIYSPTELSWLGPQGGQTARFIQSPTELSWPGPRRGQTLRFIYSPTELSWPRPRRGQTVRYIHSPTELLWPGPWRGQTARFIYSPTELSGPTRVVLVEADYAWGQLHPSRAPALPEHPPFPSTRWFST